MENWTPLQDLRKSKYNKGGKEDEDSERLKFWGTSDAIEKRVPQLPDVEGQEETLLKSRFQGPSPRFDMGQELSESTENSSNSGGPWKTLWERLTAGPRKPAEGDFTLKGRGFLQQGEREGFPEESVQKEQSGSRRGGNVLQMRTRSRPPRGHIMKGSKSSDQFSCSVVSDSLWPHGLQHSRLPCPLPTPRAYSNSCPSSWWCHPTISSSVIPFSFCLQSFPASRSFPVSQFFPSGGQSIGTSTSASVLPMNIQVWFPLGLTGLIFLQFKELSRVFSNTTVQKHHSSAFSLLYRPILTSIHDWKNHSFS